MQVLAAVKRRRGEGWLEVQSVVGARVQVRNGRIRSRWLWLVGTEKSEGQMT